MSGTAVVSNPLRVTVQPTTVKTTLRVKVRTRGGRAIAGAKVKLTSPAREVTTGADGLATFTIDKIPGHRFLRDTFSWGNTSLDLIDQMHMVGLLRLFLKLHDDHGIAAIYTQGVNGNPAGKTLDDGSVNFDCHTYGRALDFGGMSKERPDPKTAGKAMGVRLGTDFIVFLHWGSVPMWNRFSVAANPGNPGAWTRQGPALDDGFNYAQASTPPSQLHYRLDPAPFQDLVPALLPPDADLTAALGRVAPHFTEARALFQAVFDFAVAEYQDANATMGPLPAGQTDPQATAIDSATGHFVLHPDHGQPNTRFTKQDGTQGQKADGRGAHINHLHFQVGPTGYSVTRSQ